MVIECISCLRRFNLNENLLKSTGSLVRCSKCGNIFPAYHAHEGNRLNPAVEADEIAIPGFEKRKHARVPVSIPVLCDALDLEGNPSDIHLGAIKEVSQAGLAIELFTSPISGQVSLSFIDVENSEVQNLQGRQTEKMDKKNQHPRRSERFPLEAPIGFMVALNPSLFNSKISNCSEEGVFFESELKLLPGTVAFISLEGDSKYCRAEVKWSKKLDIAGAERYGIVAEYIDVP
jgi:predicted Zn finger-like uncharacterized protein